MARKRISELPLDTAVVGTDVLPIVSDGATKRVQLSTLGTYFSSVGGGTPSSHASTHAAGGSDPVTLTVAQVTGLQAALDGKQAAGSYVVTSDARLTDTREWSASTVTQAEAEAGTSADRRAFTPLRVFQAIAAWWNGSAAKTKLDGISSGATANSTDAQLRDRSTHTGTQEIATVYGLQQLLDAKAAATHTHSIAQVTNLQSSLDMKSSLTHVHGTAAITSGVFDIARIPTGTTATTVAVGSHVHGNLTSAGAIGSTSGLVVVTGASGAVGTLAQGTAGQVLRVNSTATGVEWGTAGASAAVDVRSDTVGATTYTGRAAAGSATSALAWTIRRTVLTSAGAVSSTATATNVRWDDRLTATYT